MGPKSSVSSSPKVLLHFTQLGTVQLALLSEPPWRQSPWTMEEFTKTLYAFLSGPDDVFGGTGHVFDATTEGGYTKLFGVAGEVWPALTNEVFERYAGIWFVCNKAREYWKEESRKTKDSALERRWMFYYALGCVIRKAHEGLDDQFSLDMNRSATAARTVNNSRR